MEKKHVKVMGTNVLVKLEDGENKTVRGIVLPDTVKDNVTLARGSVIAKGPGFLLPSYMENDEMASLLEQQDAVKVRYIPLDVNEGDTVYFNKDAADAVLLDGKQYLILPYGQIRLVVPCPLSEVLNG